MVTNRWEPSISIRNVTLGIFRKLLQPARMSKPGRTHRNQSISFPPTLLKSAKERAQRLTLSLSRYVQLVVEKDLVAREAIVLEEKDPPRGKAKMEG